ncbi:MAG: DUF1501 domain-containing protein [Tahibacter sp.]
MPLINRRDFLKTCSAGALASGVGGSRLAFATGGIQDVLVIVFQRGACDGLSLVPPGSAGQDRALYETYRVNTRVPASGTGAVLDLPNSGGRWGMHPRASALRNLYLSNHLAVVVGAGMPAPVTRSHFDAQKTMEFGTPGQQSVGAGWLTRHLQSSNLPASVAVPAVSMGSITATSLLGSSETITMPSGADFRLDSFSYAWDDLDSGTPSLQGALQMMPNLWTGDSLLEVEARQALDALSQFRPLNFDLYNASSNPGGYQPAGGANYGTGSFGQQLRNIAQLVKRQAGLSIATVDIGGWDTHNGQGSPANTYDAFGNQVQTLSDGLSAFYTDLSAGATNYMNHVSVIVVTEFGRRVRENDSGGTDHGYGSVMLAMGGAVNGGQVFGTYAGLEIENLYEYADVNVTTDYRRVLSEAMIRRLENPNIYYAFPGYSGYAPMGIFQGTDLPPGNFDAIFKNGFQT